MNRDEMIAQMNAIADGKPMPRITDDRYGVDGAEAVLEPQWPEVPPPRDDAPEPPPPNTWNPIDLGPYLRGEIEPVRPSVGAIRTDGQRLLYPGLEHAVISHTSTGKTWFALTCVTAELLAGNTVVYLHFEESTPASTVERLLRVGLPAGVIEEQLLFIAPSNGVRREWLTPLTERRPSLVIIDGVNEAMVLHGVKIDLEGWSQVRRRVVVPFKAVGATVLECDHLPLSADPLRGDAYGTVHKGNVIDGARFALVRKEPFGRGRRGRSYLYATKDRPGYLGLIGDDDDKGNVYLGTLVLDDSPSAGPDFLTLYAPRPKSDTESGSDTASPADIVFKVISELPEQRVSSFRKLCAALRKAGQNLRTETIRDAVDDLVVEEPPRLIEVRGTRGALGYRVLTVSQGSGS